VSRILKAAKQWAEERAVDVPLTRAEADLRIALHDYGFNIPLVEALDHAVDSELPRIREAANGVVAAAVEWRSDGRARELGYHQEVLVRAVDRYVEILARPDVLVVEDEASEVSSDSELSLEALRPEKHNLMVEALGSALFIVDALELDLSSAVYATAHAVIESWAPLAKALGFEEGD
jgi:hypothetical protein